MNSDNQGLAERIRFCVDKIGNGNEFCRLTGINRRTLDYYLSATSEPKAFALLAIAKAGQVSLDWLISGQELSVQDGTSISDINKNELKLAIETVEESLSATNRLISSTKKAELILAIYDIFTSKEKATSAQIINILSKIS